MSIVRIGIQTKCLGEPLKKGLQAAARLGGGGVVIDAHFELPPADLSDTAVRHVRKLLSDQRLQVAAVSFPTRRGYAVTERFEERIAATRAAMQGAPTADRATGEPPRPGRP